MSCKIVMVIISSAICLTGVVAVIIGVLVENKSEPADGILEYKDILLEFLQLAKVGSLLIGIGSIITIIGFLGCCGAMFENKCMLMTFFIIILIMVIVEVVAVAIVLSNSQVENLCKEFVRRNVERYEIGKITKIFLDIFTPNISAMIVSMVLYTHLPGNLQVFSAAC